MFSICPKKIYQNKGLTGTDLRVYLTLQGFADDNGYCFPSVSRIADICGVNRRTVFRSLCTLEQFGAIARQKRIRDSGGFTSNAFYLKLEPDDVTNMSLGGCQECHRGSVIDVTSNNNQFNPNSFLNTKGARVGARKTAGLLTDDMSSVTEKDTNDVLSYVSKHKQAYKDYEFFLTGGSTLKIRPKSALIRSEELELDMLEFFSRFRDVRICAYNDRYLNEQPIILQGVF